MTTTKQVSLSSLDPNPYRDLERFPVQPAKVAAIRASIEETGQWHPIRVRQVGRRWEIIHGHNTVEALRQIDPKAKVEVRVVDRDDFGMIRELILENSQAYDSNLYQKTQEVSTVIRALQSGTIGRGDSPGQIPVFPVGENTPKVRCAGADNPAKALKTSTLTKGEGDAKEPDSDLIGTAYSSEAIAEFMGASKRTVDRALNILSVYYDGKMPLQECNTFTQRDLERVAAVGRNSEMTIDHVKHVVAAVKEVNADPDNLRLISGGKPGDLIAALKLDANATLTEPVPEPSEGDGGSKGEPDSPSDVAHAIATDLGAVAGTASDTETVDWSEAEIPDLVPVFDNLATAVEMLLPHIKRSKQYSEARQRIAAAVAQYLD